MFRIDDEFQDDRFMGGKKEPPDPGGTPLEPKVQGSPVTELRSRIKSDPPTLESEVQDELGTFRGRSLSAPPILWAAQKYGRELRRMSDEFHGALQVLPRPKSAGTASQLRRCAGWKETFQNWWRRTPPCDAPPSSPQ
uniref:Bcl2-associated agonist of cell death n=1 Tax=Sphenodon punctatus TaxID=8508 RepID=A0A8D0GMW5_SPHPU